MSGRVNKFLVALAGATGVLASALPDGITGQELSAIVMAYVGAALVYLVPNKTDNVT